MPKGEIPRLLLAKAKRWSSDRWERIQYPRGQSHQKGWKAPLQALQPLGLIHPEAITPGFGKLFLQHFPHDAELIIHEADQAMNLIFDLLGSGPVDLKTFRERKDLKFISNDPTLNMKPASVAGRIPWHFDFKAGIGWDPKTFFADIRYGHVFGVDVKVPWELSRGQHLVTLGQAYRLTYDEKYARAFFIHVEDWIEQNPIKWGVNWASPMDAALRAGNWLLAWDLFYDAPSCPTGFRETFSHVLFEHGKHITQHLERGGGITSNHYLSNLLGLLYIGHFLQVKKWQRFAAEEMCWEIQKQTYDDGFDYESSTSYHRLVTEMFFFATLLQERWNMAGDEPDNVKFKTRLHAMFLCLQKLLQPNGLVPLIGDNDSGRVHLLFKREDADHRYLLNLGAALFKDSHLKVQGWEKSSELAWLFGFRELEAFKAQPGIEPNKLGSKPPSRSGLVVLRGHDDYLSFSAQPNGTRGIGNHTHNDKLSFTLHVRGDDFIVDPGSTLYTPNPSLRNKFRSTAMHNTVEVDGREQNEFLGDSLFTLSNDAQVEIVNYKEGHLIEAQHTGYRRLDEPVLHHRRIARIDEPLQWTLHDELKGRHKHQLKWTFVLGPGIRVNKISANTLQLVGSRGELQLVCGDNGSNFSIEEGLVSPAYGVCRETKIIRLIMEKQLPCLIEFSLNWKKL